jgi:hypothetical protein
MTEMTLDLIDVIFWRTLIVVAVGLIGLAIVLRFTRQTSAS